MLPTTPLSPQHSTHTTLTMSYQNMWRTSRAEFNTHIRLTLLQIWMFPSTPGTSHNFLTETVSHLSDPIPEPRNMGQAFACLFEILEALPQVILQGPDLNVYSDIVIAVIDAVAERFSQAPSGTRGMADTPRELNNLIVETLSEFFSDDSDEGGASELEQDRMELLTETELGPERLERLSAYSWPITLICFYVVIDVFMPLFRSHWSDEQFDEFINGLESGLPNDNLATSVLLEYPDLDPIDYDEYHLPEGYNDFGDEDFIGENGVEYAPNDGQYAPAGQPVPLDQFCQPITSAANVDDVDCNICSNRVTDIEPGDQAVVTACMHYFHANCLASWVNESGADNSNACPHCRTRMCERRARTSVQDDFQDGSDVDDNTQGGAEDNAPGEDDENPPGENDEDSPGENDGSEGEDDGAENRRTALREYIVQYRAAVAVAVSPEEDLNAATA